MGLEGIVGKRAASPYVTKRSADWVKVNAAKSDDFVVVGFSPASNGAKGFSALLLAQYRDGDLDVCRPSRQRLRATRLRGARTAARCARTRRPARGRQRRARRRVARRRAGRAGQVQAAYGRRTVASARVSASARRQARRRVRLARRGCRGRGAGRRAAGCGAPRRPRRGTSRSRTWTRCSGRPTGSRRAI